MTKDNSPKWFQKLFYKESILAIKSSMNFLSYESFKNDLVLLLPQESKSSRARIASNILHRFFADKKILSFCAQVWQAYQDESLLKQAISYELLSKEPVIADFYLNYIWNKPIGSKFSPQVFDEFIEKTYGKNIKNLVWWLQSAFKELGFIQKSGLYWAIKENKSSDLLFILALHKKFALYPAEIDVKEILADDFYKFIGLKTAAEAENLIYKYHLYSIIEYKEGLIKTIYPYDRLFALIFPDKA